VQSASDVSSSLAPRIAEISADVYGLIVREIPQLRGDKRDLARSTDNASIVSAAGLRIADITSAYIDKVSEEMLSAYEAGKENWLRNLSVARGARVQALLRGERADVDASEAILGYRLRQHHLGVVCWIADAAPGGSALGALEQATAEMTRQAGRFSCPKTSPVHGPGSRSAPERPSPACALSEQNPESGSPSARPVPEYPASAALTSRPWARIPWRSRQVGQGGP
jgi:hypothetical protein